MHAETVFSDIGNRGVAGEAGIIRIGTSGTHTATYLAGVRDVAVSGVQPVGVNANGQLGVRASSARFKEAIKPMDKASEAIHALKPVTFRYKKELDPQTGATVWASGGGSSKRESRPGHTRRTRKAVHGPL